MLAPLLLELVDLAPGDGLFVGAGVLHSYLHGAGVEVQATSDNVLRGGLTAKQVDLAELLRTVRFEPASPHQRVAPRPVAAGLVGYDVPVDDFAVWLADAVVRRRTSSCRSAGRPSSSRSPGRSRWTGWC